MTVGSNDVVLIYDAPDGSEAVAVGMAAAASGSLSKIETVRAWTSSEFKGIAEKAARVQTHIRRLEDNEAVLSLPLR